MKNICTGHIAAERFVVLLERGKRQQSIWICSHTPLPRKLDSINIPRAVPSEAENSLSSTSNPQIVPNHKLLLYSLSFSRKTDGENIAGVQLVFSYVTNRHFAGVAMPWAATGTAQEVQIREATGNLCGTVHHFEYSCFFSWLCFLYYNL